MRAHDHSFGVVSPPATTLRLLATAMISDGTGPGFASYVSHQPSELCPLPFRLIFG